MKNLVRLLAWGVVQGILPPEPRFLDRKDEAFQQRWGIVLGRTWEHLGKGHHEPLEGLRKDPAPQPMSKATHLWERAEGSNPNHWPMTRVPLPEALRDGFSGKDPRLLLTTGKGREKTQR